MFFANRAAHRMAGGAFPLDRRTPELELDLRDLEYVDSTGLSAIIEANRRSEAEIGRRARLLIREDGPVRRMLELTLLHLTLDVRVA